MPPGRTTLFAADTRMAVHAGIGQRGFCWTRLIGAHYIPNLKAVNADKDSNNRRGVARADRLTETVESREVPADIV